MKYSVNWANDQIIAKLGKKTVQSVLKSMSYGNADFSAGEKLAVPDAVLKISPREQATFLRKLWTEKLPVSKRAMALTRKILFTEDLNDQGQLYGKTGSCCIDRGCESAPGRQLAWFVGVLAKGKDQYAFATNFSDLEPSHGYAGGAAKAFTKTILTQIGLIK
jgi:beta-lactamase class D